MVDFDHAFTDPQNSPSATGRYIDLWHYPEDGDSVEQHVHRRIADLTRDNPHKFWVGVRSVLGSSWVAAGQGGTRNTETTK